ncbi:HET-domain-containing protein [Lophiostoma macrostomum CBS 122681]|uniref:HET-domain-containing protein n=1 Tax=Lophiostoma macrostomum CBS 122681 TaxID=1314788 RepID=A0A6A6SSM0_9PLEO|nr:HET-domain-containing protein [Lophiostoma macrostomum CBS 122681]
MMPTSDFATPTTKSIRLLQPTRVTATVSVDTKPATYLPPVLCATCDRADLLGLLRPQGFAVDDIELREAKARCFQLSWHLYAVHQSAAQCQLCQLLLECLKGCKGFDAAEASFVFVRLVPIAEYQEMGELTLWMTMTRKRPKPTMGKIIRCQLRVGLRMPRSVEDSLRTFDRAISRIPTGPRHTEGEPNEGDQSFSAVLFPSDHPPRDRVGIGYVASNLSQPLPFPTCARVFGRDSSWEDESILTLTYEENVDSLLGIRTASSGLVEQLSSLCIRVAGRKPHGQMDRNSWRYEVDNIMTARRLDIRLADLDLAAYWIRICTLWHASTCPPLIRITPNLNAFTLRVIDVKNQCVTAAPSRCKYAALSYTWGGYQQCKLLQGNLKEMSQTRGLQKYLKKLPRTVSDAIIVCQRLNIRYLWVDALCIIQDSARDQEIQIGSMCYVYGGAHLTIVAGFGNNADAGLPGISLPRKYQYSYSKIDNLNLITAPVDALDSLLRSRWYTRGWTYQELILSRRILAFTEEQMVFFCVEAFFQEDMVVEPVNGLLDREQNSVDFIDRHIAISGHNFHEPSEGLVDQAIVSYRKLLTAFLHRDLSFDGDVLNAFAGILDALSTYLGGFRWGISIRYPNRTLTWNSRNVSSLQRRTGFPSWSWAGWKGYTGDLKFHSSLTPSLIKPEPCFYSISRDRNMIPFARLHDHDAKHHSQKMVISDEEWDHVQSDVRQYLVLVTRTIFLTVDFEANTAGTRFGADLHSYAMRRGTVHIGEIYLDPAWRSQKPAELEFVSIARSMMEESLMLIQRVGPVAYRIQMTDTPVVNVGWSVKELKPQTVILG